MMHVGDIMSTEGGVQATVVALPCKGPHKYASILLEFVNKCHR